MLVAMIVPAADLLTAKSADGVTVVITGGLTLFPGTGSPVGDVTLALLVNEPLAGAVTTSEKFVVAFTAKFARFQLTTPALTVPPPVALTKVAPAGSASVTTTLLAKDGPKFVNVTV